MLEKHDWYPFCSPDDCLEGLRPGEVGDDEGAHGVLVEGAGQQTEAVLACEESIETIGMLSILFPFWLILPAMSQSCNLSVTFSSQWTTLARKSAPMVAL